MIYTCPMHPEIKQSTPGNCPKCGMVLVLEGGAVAQPRRKLKDFAPLIILFAHIILFTVAMQILHGTWDVMYAMRNFEGAFFILFGAFKLLNWKGFVHAYQTYDLIAKRSRLYAYAYPLIELALGIAFLSGVFLLEASIITLLIMIVGTIGVWQALRAKNDIPCACMGVVFKLPMTWVTLMEDLLMGFMALYMITMLV